ncbi:uncharacterized protein BDR25DRAFT_372851, partial [Lindgomyces ingoldianus]
RKHVLADLQPYICTYPDCKLNDYPFENKEEWFNHETQSHRYELFCNTEGHASFWEASGFLEHMKKDHEDCVNENQLPALRRMFEQPTHPTSGACTLCQKQAVKLKTHLSRHLEQLSLFAIPQ